MRKTIILIFCLLMLACSGCRNQSELVQTENPTASSVEEIEADIDNMLAALGRKVNMEPALEKVAAHGGNAVPLLIRRYNNIEQEKQGTIIACLCKIKTDDALEFVREIMLKREYRSAVSQAIRLYPTEKEDEIISILMDLLTVKYVGWDAKERIREMILRKPSQAEYLVNTLKDCQTYEKRNYCIVEVLAWVSGYSHTCSYRNNFWRDWWKRNKDKEVFDWLVETLYSDPKNYSRQAEALQVLGSLKDQRSIPHLAKALDSPSQRVRYWAVVGLKKLEGTYESSGYRFDKFTEEEEEIIKKLRKKFSNDSECSKD